MALPVILAPLVSMLMDKGLDLAAKAIDGGAEKAKEFIEEKTGVKLDPNKNLTAKDVQAIKKMEEDPEVKIKLQELALEKLKEENRHEELHFTTSHNTYNNKSDMADGIAQQIINRNLPIIAILVVINVALVYFMQEYASLIAIASNIIGVAIGNLFNERQAIINFFFGSSIGSKEKDAAMARGKLNA